MTSSKAPQEGQPEMLSGPTKKKTALRVPVFAENYARSGNVSAAAKASRTSPWMHYRRLKNDPVYREWFEQAQAQIGQELEDLAIDRVRNGVKKLLWWRNKPRRLNGRLCYEVEFDTTLHVNLLKRFNPAAYREHATIEHSGSINLVERLEAARARLIAIKREEDEKQRG